MSATPFTRRDALKNGLLGVASITVAERLLSYGGANDALAAMKPTLSKPGYGPLQFESGKAFALPKGFHYVRFGRAGTENVRRPPDPDLPRWDRLFQGQRRHRLDRAQPGGLSPRQALTAP